VWLVAKAATKQAQAALRAWGVVHGDIQVRHDKGDYVLGFSESQRVSRPDLDTVMATPESQRTELWKQSKSSRFGLRRAKPATPPAVSDAEALESLEAAFRAGQLDEGC
jgi:hypothetical protein